MNTKGFSSTATIITIVIGFLIIGGADYYLLQEWNLCQQPPPALKASDTPIVDTPTSIEYFSQLPYQIIVTDPEGRVTGMSMATGKVYTEIPNSSYAHDAGGDLIIAAPEAGKYTLSIEGATAGNYMVELHVPGGEIVTATGTIQANKVIVYTQNYDPKHPANTTFSL